MSTDSFILNSCIKRLADLLDMLAASPDAEERQHLASEARGILEEMEKRLFRSTSAISAYRIDGDRIIRFDPRCGGPA